MARGVVSRAAGASFNAPGHDVIGLNQVMVRFYRRSRCAGIGSRTPKSPSRIIDIKRKRLCIFEAGGTFSRIIHSLVERKITKSRLRRQRLITELIETNICSEERLTANAPCPGRGTMSSHRARCSACSAPPMRIPSVSACPPQDCRPGNGTALFLASCTRRVRTRERRAAAGRDCAIFRPATIRRQPQCRVPRSLPRILHP